MNLTQDQMDVLLFCANSRCIDIKQNIRILTSDESVDIDMGAITGLTKEFNDLQGAMMQLSMNGAKMQ